MGLPVIISETAFNTFKAIFEQIEERLGQKVASDFKKETIRVLQLISNAPLIYEETKLDSNIRKGITKKLSSVFYEVRLDKIEVLFFSDNRQEPMNS